MTDENVTHGLIYFLHNMFNDFFHSIIVRTNMLLLKHIPNITWINIWNKMKMNSTVLIIKNNWFHIWIKLSSDVATIRCQDQKSARQKSRHIAITCASYYL